LSVKDSSAKLDEPNIYKTNKRRFTPIEKAASLGHLDVIKWWIASGREMDLGKPGDRKDALGKAGKTEVVTLLERFQSDAAKTRSEVRKELGITGQCYCSFSFSLFTS